MSLNPNQHIQKPTLKPPTPTASTINNVSILHLRGWIGFRVVSLNYKLMEGLAETLLDLNSGISTKEF